MIQVVGVNTSGPSLALGTTMFLEMRVVARGEALCDAPVPGLGDTPGANLTYLAPPQDNFSWVPNRSLGPQKCKEFLSSKINSIAL